MCPVTKPQTYGRTDHKTAQQRQRASRRKPTIASRAPLDAAIPPECAIFAVFLACRADFLGCGAHLSCAARTYFLRW